MTEASQVCPGFASYRTLPDLSIEVNGQVPKYSADSRSTKKLLELDQKYGDAVRAKCKQHKVPVPWFFAIMAIESSGDPEACSPCIKFDSKGNQICSFAPNCGGPCCAYGLMQFIDMTARMYGHKGQELLGNPALAIDLAAQLIAKHMAKFGYDLVKISAAYNAGYPRCSGQGTFGLTGQRDYAMHAVKYANTHIAMGLSQSAGMGTPSAPTGLLIMAAAAGAAWFAMTRTRAGKKLTHQAADALLG